MDINNFYAIDPLEEIELYIKKKKKKKERKKNVINHNIFSACGNKFAIY